MPKQTVSAFDTIHRNQRWLSAWIGTEMMMMDGQHASYLSLSETAGRLWDLLETPATVVTLATALGDEFQIDEAEALAATEAFMAEMAEEGIIHVERAPSR